MAELSITRNDLKAAIPARCFEPSIGRSFAYLIFDLLMIAGLYALLAQTSTWALKAPIIFLIGTLLWSLFVIGHDAGHGGFAKNRTLNTWVGLLTHGVILVPYRSWQRSHASHHMNTGHLKKEEVFRPVQPGQDNAFRKIIFRSGLFLLIGWPMYLLGFRNITTYSPIKGSHFTTVSDLYAEHVKVSYLASVAIVAGFAAVYGWIGFRFGWEVFATYVLLPYLVFAGWLTFVTYMQHVSPEVPSYDTDSWTGLKGALATVDRNYFPFNWLTHHIGDRHVIHHIFPTIPHYHLVEATEAVKPLLGERYLSSPRWVWRDFYRTLTRCHFVEKTADGPYAYQSAYRWIRGRRGAERKPLPAE